MKIAIIGGVAAGMSAAAKARRENPEAHIEVFERGPHISYGACGMPYVISKQISDFQRLVARTPEQFAKQNIQVHLHHDVEEINVSGQRISGYNDAQKIRFEASFDRLLIATGASAVVPPWPGKERKGVHTLRTLEHGYAVEQALQDGARHAVIVGGGYIGLEMAEAFHARGLRVTVVEQLPRVMGTIDEEIATQIEQELEKHGVALQCNTSVTAILGDEKVQKVETSEGIIDDVDLVLVAVGVRPNSQIAQSCGVQVNARGAIATDAQMRTNVPLIYAAGDVAEVFHRITQKPAYIPLGDTANKQGRTAGVNLAGGNVTFSGVVGTSVCKIFDIAVARTGLSTQEAQAAGIPTKAVSITDHDHAGYYPDRRPITVRLLYQPQDGKLLGAQIVGYGDAVKRIDVIAALLHHGGTIEDLMQLDLAYAPPFSPVWDPLLVAANQAK